MIPGSLAEQRLCRRGRGIRGAVRDHGLMRQEAVGATAIIRNGIKEGDTDRTHGAPPDSERRDNIGFR